MRLNSLPSNSSRSYAKLKYGWLLAYCCGVCLVPKMYRKSNSYGEEYYDGVSEQSRASGSLSLQNNETHQKTLSSCLDDSGDLGIVINGEGSNEIDGMVNSSSEIGVGNEERSARKISANTSLANVPL